MAMQLNGCSNPLVSVVTPVYNGEKYLDDCIESVLSQTYDNWEYIILNNCSTDGSEALARQYAQKDRRIKVHTTDRHLEQMANWNRAISMISDESKYCKVVHADDWLFSDCISEMVNIAEQHPEVSIVGSYRLDETTVNLDGLPYPSHATRGRDICRKFFIENLYLFGSPTSLLLRSDCIRSRDKFYNEANIHADQEICFELLKDSDFGFIHKVLTFTRRHNETTTTFIRRFKTYPLGDLWVIKNYGRLYLNQEEYEHVLNRKLKSYYRMLASHLLKPTTEGFLAFHKKELKKIGLPMETIRLVNALVASVFNKALNMLKIK
jgi:glycosyltransferase involved in cell wall biosynthesis